jgi:UDP-N-acetylmuramoylalanine--D-glutamate ligase
MKFKNKKILIVGFGASGQAAARFFLEEGAKVAVTDLRTGEKSLPVEFHFGGHPPEIFERRDLIVVSPGVPSDLPGLLLARRRRIPILGEFGLASELLKFPMIAVTGTNGKSTTATLIARLLEEGGKKTALAGNIGKPLLEVVMENRKGDPRDRPAWVVAEVSSYQLETVRKFHPKVAVILNITEDHLDRYPSFEAYARAKFRIFKEQGPRDLLIYKEDDPMIRKGIRQARARKIGFSVGANLVRNRIVYGKEEYRLDRVRLVGLHNVENMTASIVAARSVGVTPLSVQRGLEGFEGLPHRTEFVREREGVRYYDDSKGTNVDAVVKSLAGFPDKSVVLIAGGRDKGGSYEPLREMAAKKTKLLILIGEARDKIARAMNGSSVETVAVEKLEEAVPLAARRAEPGDVVLLSPACSSFDQFKDYKERGVRFQTLVRTL